MINILGSVALYNSTKGKPAGAMEKLEMRASLARLAALCKAADDWERDIIHQYQTNGFAELAEDSDEEA